MPTLPSEKGVWGCWLSGEEGWGVPVVGFCAQVCHCLPLAWHCAATALRRQLQCPTPGHCWRVRPRLHLPASSRGCWPPPPLPAVPFSGSVTLFWAALAPPSAGQGQCCSTHQLGFFFNLGSLYQSQTRFTDGYNAARYLLSPTKPRLVMAVIPVISLEQVFAKISLQHVVTHQTRW